MKVVNKDRIGVGVVGFGYWGPNLVRNFSQSSDSHVVAVCDTRPESLESVRRSYPHIIATSRYEDLLENDEIDLIALATPVSTHARLGLAAIDAGKHVLAEKPLAATRADAGALVERAAASGVALFVDHTFVFAPAVQKMKSLVDAEGIGRLLYYDSTRINLGLFQHDTDVVWDLVPHDLSILDVILSGKLPQRVSCWGVNHFGEFADLAYATLMYDANFIAHIHVNWLAPVKIRQVLLCGDAKMLVYDETATQEKLRIYDRGVKVRDRADVYKRLVEYREGDMVAPRLDNVEPLAAEVANINAALRGLARPIADGAMGLRVTTILEALSLSLARQGRPVEIAEIDDVTDRRSA